MFYFPDGVGWQVYGIGYWQPMWIDFAEYPSLQKLQADATTGTHQCVLGPPQSGVQPLHVTLTLDLLAGSLVLSPGCSTEELASGSAPSGYAAGQWPADCRVVGRLWEQWQTVQKDPDWKEWHEKDARPFITFHFQVADLNEKKTYDDNLAAEEAAWEEWLKSGGDTMDSGTGGGMMLLSGGGGCNGCPVIETNAFNICSVNYDAGNATATVTWESCNTHFYDVFSAEELSFNTQWNFRTNLLGQVSSTAWTDYDNLSVLTARFYRVARLASRDDLDGDGLSNAQEALAGSDPRDADTDNDGILDGPFNTNNVVGVSYSLSGIPDALPNDPTRSVDTDGDGIDDLTDSDGDNDGIPDSSDPNPVVPITVAPFKTVSVQTNNVVGDTGTEVFDVSSRGRPLPYAAGSSAQHGFGRLYGGIYFNHDATNLYVGVAGLDQASGNVLLVLLDTDGTGGGVTNLAQMITGNTPFGITRSRNLSFSGATFTPNVGILVGSKFGDGQNFANFQIPAGGVDFGQGVFGLSATTATNFPGFTGTGARISQWGDANDYAANAGIEIAISKAALGLTNGAIFRAGAIIGGGANAQNARWFSREAYGESVSGTGAFPNDFTTNAVTLIGAPVYLSTNPAPAYAPVTVSDNDVMMQGFYWDVPKDPSNDTNGTWYVELQSRAIDLATNGFTSIWFPPPSKGLPSNAKYSMGYNPYDHYDLGEYLTGANIFEHTVETRFGSRAELQAAVDAFRDVGVEPYADIVVNHMKSDSSTFIYTYPHRIFQKGTNDFYIGTTNLVCDPFHKQSGVDFGDEVNQTVPHMRLGLEAWGEWLVGVIGFDGSRFDMSSSIEPWYLAEWLSRPAITGKFAVLEHDNGASPRELQTYAQLVDQRATVFDFPLRAKLAAMCTNAVFDISQMYRAGVAGVAPDLAVTFVENHDTIRPCFDDKVGITTNKVLAYAYIMLSEGLPCVFYHDYYELPDAILTNKFFQCQGGKNDAFRGEPLKPKIDRLILARKLYAAGTTTFISDTNSNNVYVVRRTGGGPSSKPGCVLAINRAPTNITVTVNTAFASTNLVDRVDTNSTPFSVTTSASGTATFGVPGKGYRVLAP